MVKRSYETFSLESWVYLSDWILAVVLGISFVFYFSRLVGFVLSCVLKISLWKRYKVHVSFNAFRISPLGGRITATNVVLSNSDYTISILKFNLTWRYWLLSMIRIAEIFFVSEEQHGETNGLSSELNRKLETSIEILMDGLEIFMYNRKCQYDNIVTTLEKAANGLDSGEQSDISEKVSTILGEHFSTGNTSDNQSIEDAAKHDTSLLRILPIGFRVKRGAFVLGNHTTPHIIVASFDIANATIDIARSPSAYDKCRINFEMNMENFRVSMKPNITYAPDRYSNDKNPQDNKKKKHLEVRPSKRRKNFLKKSQQFITRHIFQHQRKAEQKTQDWRGLRRYVGDFKGDPVIELDDIEEYAKYSILLESLSTKLIYYFDIAGRNPEELSSNKIDCFPKFGVDIILTTALINYGSWADRQRSYLHALLFPYLAQDSVASDFFNGPGAHRRYEGFNLRIMTTDELVMRIPTREFSKDREDLKTQAAVIGQKQTRPFGWIEVTTGSTTKISLFTSYLVTSKGSRNKLDVNLSELEVRTSVTHDILFSADTHYIGGDISFPLKWNAECIWNFDMKSKNGQLFLLGEHITLFTDLVSDFSSGPPTKHEYFRPFVYNLLSQIEGYQIYLNANDGNVFDSPLDFDSNTFLCFQGNLIDMNVKIPTKGLFAKFSKIDFSIVTPNLEIYLKVPLSHTIGSFMSGDKCMCSTGLLCINGYYKAYNAIEVNHNNLANIDVSADDVSLLFFGYFIKYLFALKENYFGDCKEFQTCDEYLQVLAQGDGMKKDSLEEEEDTDYWGHYKIENDLNIVFTFSINRGLLIFPCQVYDYEHHIGVLFNSLDVDIHLTNYYMDLQTDFSPADCHYFAPGTLQSKDVVFDMGAYMELVSSRDPEFIIDSFSVHSHRILGLDLNTYQCKWDFAAGDVLINGDPMCLIGLQAGLLSFGLGYKDYENAHKYTVPIIYDAANFSFRCPKLEAKLKNPIGSSVCRVLATDILLSFNDIANLRYSDRITILLPSIVAEIIDLEDSSHSMFLKTSLIFNNICQKDTMLQHRLKQQKNIRRNDAPTHRVSFLLFDEYRDLIYNDAFGSRYLLVSLPTASKPLNLEDLYSDDDSLSERLSDKSFSNFSNLDDFVEPTIEYFEEDFMPQKAPIPDQKNDALILEFDTIEAFLSPNGLKNVSEILLRMQNLDLNSLIDKLQCETVKKIVKTIRLVSVVTNIRFVCPSINLKVAGNNSTDLASVLSGTLQTPIISMLVLNPSVVATETSVHAKAESNVKKETSSSLVIQLEDIKVSVTAPSTSYSAFSLQIRDLEAWLDESESEGTIISPSFLEVEVMLQESLFSWLLGFGTQLFDDIKPALENFTVYSNSSKVWKQQLALLLSTSADVMEHHLDPKVITKPSRLHRSVIDHVRCFDSWKVVSKFRGILNDLRSYQDANKQFADRKWCVPANAFDIVDTSFRNWRAWEGNLDQRRAFFESIFPKEKKSDLPIISFVKVGSLSISLLNMDDCKDFLSIRDMNLHVSQKMVAPMARLSLLPSPSMKSAADVLLSIKDCDLSISQCSLHLVEVLKQELGDLTKNLSNSETVKRKRAKSTGERVSSGINVSITVRVNSFHFYLALYFTHLSFLSIQTSMNLMMSPGITSNEQAVTIRSEQNDFSIGHDDLDFLVFNTRGIDLVLGASLGKAPKFVVDLITKEVLTQIRDRNHQFCKFLTNFNKDVEKLKSISKDFSLNEGPETISEAPNTSVWPEVILRTEVKNLSFFSDIISPLKLHLVIKNSKLQAAVYSDRFEIKSGYQNLLLEIGLAEVPITRIESSRFGSSVELNRLEDILLLRCDLNLGYFKLTIQLFFSTANTILQYQDKLESEILKLRNSLKLFLTEKDSDIEFEESHEDFQGNSMVPEKKTKIIFELNTNQEYCGFLTYKDLCRYSLEAEGINVSLSNFDKGLSTPSFTVPVFGEAICTVARFTVLDPLFPVGLSTIIDLNVLVKLLNNEVGINNEGESQSIQVISDHFRVCLSPHVVFKLLDFSQGVKLLIQKYDTLSNKPSKSKLRDIQPTEGREPKIYQLSALKMPNISSIHVLSYGFCIGWLFNGSYKDYPGFICGAERLFAVVRSDIGKLTMMNGYLSVANGTTASSFYSTSSELHGLNRAFMPKLQINYFVDEARKLWINFKGDEIDVRFMSNSKIAIERTVKSIADLQKYLDMRRRTEQMKNKLVPKTENATRSTESTRSLKPDFPGVEVTIGFDGANILLYRFQNNDFNDSPSSLTLHCPAVLTVILYEAHKDLERKHLVRVEMIISTSDNTLYPACVPVISDFINAFSGLFTTSQKKKVVPKSKPLKLGAGLGDLHTLIKDFDFHVGLIIEPQRVCLSCEPIAKVAAVVDFEGASLTLSSGIQTSDTVHALVKVKSVSASLQHIYSNEMSGKIEVQSILFSNVISLLDSVENFTSISVSEINGCLKMKQYQDVDLFIDIWSPGDDEIPSLSSVDKPARRESGKSEKDLHTRNDEVAKTQKTGLDLSGTPNDMSAILVQIEFIISKMSLEVDFGSALGTVKLEIDKAWNISQKTSAWDYALKLGLRTMNVQFQGRLGGYLKLNKLFLNTSIEWKLPNLPILEVPLIQMAGGFGQISMKGIFDDHVFAFVSLTGWFFDVFNRKNDTDISKDYLHACLSYDAVDVNLTSLSTSDFYDIYSTINRMIEENRTSYKEILKDSNKNDDMETTCCSLVPETVKELETKIEVVTGLTRLRVFPHSFVDTRVFVLECDLSKAKFVQNEHFIGVMNQIELQLNNVIASFSSTTGTSEEFVNDAEVEEYMNYISSSKGGEMLSLPKFMISMRTYQKFESMEIEYVFQSSFGGTVNIRWNLGSVNCVRDMYATHKRALLSRTDATNFRLDESRKEDENGTSLDPDNEEISTSNQVPLSEEVHKDFEEDIQHTLEKVSTKSKYTYKALAPPIIEAPQLKELGSATPPLEWFGLHRNKFPDAVHQLAIVSLQKVLHEIEQQYSKKLRKA